MEQNNPNEVTLPVSVEQRPAFYRIVQDSLRWINNHRIKTILGGIILIIVLQVTLLPYGEINKLKNKNPDETAFMREYRAQMKSQGKPFYRMQYWISLKTIPNDAVDAVIVAEDGTFWTHEGFDWYEIQESIEKDIEEMRTARGGSTITQQLVKNLFLSASKNPLRKLKEWILTWYMERTISKSRILELYLNIIEWGDGIYGIEAASRVYFGKPVSSLAREECARLAAIIPSPRKHRADTDSKYVLNRTKIILDRMASRGL